jgi:uncharacterized protein (TIGR02147 family)
VFRFKNLDGEQYEYYQKWYYSAIRAVIQFFRFDGDYEALAKSLTPTISSEEAKLGVELLEKLELIRLNSSGIYEVTDHHISTGAEYRPLAVRAFQRETMLLASESLSRHTPNLRDISTLTLGIDEKAMEDIKEIMREARRAIQKRVDEVNVPDRVYQVNMQLFPLCLNSWRTK